MKNDRQEPSMTQDNPTITIAIVTEETTQTFQLGETVAEAIAQTKLALLPNFADDNARSIDETDDISLLVDIPDVEVNIITNSAYLNGWLKRNNYNTELVDDEDLLNTFVNENTSLTVMVPAVEHIAIQPEEGIALLPDETNILVRTQAEILRTDENDQRVHGNPAIGLMLPPEYRIVRSSVDPDTYIRVIATPSYANLTSEANTMDA